MAHIGEAKSIRELCPDAIVLVRRIDRLKKELRLTTRLLDLTIDATVLDRPDLVRTPPRRPREEATHAA